MADRGFTIKDLLEEIGVELNMPPFLEGRSQLTSDEVKAGRGIASLYAFILSGLLEGLSSSEFCKGRSPCQ